MLSVLGKVKTMARETKVGLIVAGSFLCLVGVVLFFKLRDGHAPPVNVPGDTEEVKLDPPRPIPPETTPSPSPTPTVTNTTTGANSEQPVVQQTQEPEGKFLMEQAIFGSMLASTYASWAILHEPEPVVEQQEDKLLMDQAIFGSMLASFYASQIILQEPVTSDPRSLPNQLQVNGIVQTQGTQNGPGINQTGSQNPVDDPPPPDAPPGAAGAGGQPVITDVRPANNGNGASNTTTGVGLGQPVTTAGGTAIPSGNGQQPINSQPIRLNVENTTDRNATNSKPIPPAGTQVGASVPAITVGGSRGTPRPIPAAVVESFDEEEYRVKQGDTFPSISMNFYRTDKYAQALFLFNRNHPLASAGVRQDPPVLQPGQPVFVPPTSILEKRYPTVIPNVTPLQSLGTRPGTVGERTSNASPGTGNGLSLVSYRVQGDGEMMYEIARRTLKNGDRWKEIRQLNRDYQPEVPVPGGTILNLPADAQLEGN